MRAVASQQMPRRDAPATATGGVLFPDAVARAGWEDLLTGELQSARTRVAAGSVAPRLDVERFRADLAAFDFAAPQPLDRVLPWAVDQLALGATQMTHPRYFGLFNPAPSFPSECAERIVAQFNPQLASAATSPAPVEIEAHVIRAVGRRAGLADTVCGHFTTGGSEANATALICALVTAEPRYVDDGLYAFAERPVFYVSADCHLAWHKIALQAGLGHGAMRSVATDGSGRMDAVALADAMARDRARGERPVMVVATAGTTGAGMVDPLAECARLARGNAAWFHVDAAWGGGLIAAPAHRTVLAGIELADSLTIDAHKWFATTMGCGMFITRDDDVLSRAFQVSTVFMPSNLPRHDPYVTTLQWSRRFIGLRLFLSLAAAGWDGMAEHVEHALALADLLRRMLVGRGWSVVNDSRMAVLCVLPPGGSADVRRVVQRVVASGVAWISATVFEGRDVIRICITHGETTPDDLLQLVDAMQACAAPTSRTLSAHAGRV